MLLKVKNEHEVPSSLFSFAMKNHQRNQYFLFHFLSLKKKNSLRELGYKQELKRELTSFTNFSVSFSIVSILTGLTSLYGTALNGGGPAVIIWGWVFVSLMSFIVAASMAEICSSYPTSKWSTCRFERRSGDRTRRQMKKKAKKNKEPKERLDSGYPEPHTVTHTSFSEWFHSCKEAHELVH